MNYPLEQVPFSRYGSFLGVSWSGADKGIFGEGLYLRSLHGNSLTTEIVKIETIVGGRPFPFKAKASPWELSLETTAGCVSLVFEDNASIRLRGQGIGLRLTRQKPSKPMYYADYAVLGRDGGVTLNSNTVGFQYRIRSLAGTVSLDAPYVEICCPEIKIELIPDVASGLLEAAIEEFETSWKARATALPYDHLVERARKEVRLWTDRLVASPSESAPRKMEASAKSTNTATLAAYINWMSVVEPKGYVTRPAMLMSKNHMNRVWSWDHCFNALAHRDAHPSLAWDQFALPFDLQDEHGMLPDCFNDRDIQRTFTKAPVHGWALGKLMASKHGVSDGQLRWIYPRLVAWTNWWLTHRDDNGNGLPECNHGNEGWDNATAFCQGLPMESPELSAHLVNQMAMLSQVAGRLGLPMEEAEWLLRSERLLATLIAELWNGETWMARRLYPETKFTTDSLLFLMPLVLGEKLPQHIVDKMVDRLEGRHLTPYGLATESPASPHYRSDGYWLGPIWAPPTLLICDGLHRAGRTELARDIADRFMRLVEESGAAENFDALTGEGLRDRAYTWTSSIYLILRDMFEEPGNEEGN